MPDKCSPLIPDIITIRNFFSEEYFCQEPAGGELSMKSFSWREQFRQEKTDSVELLKIFLTLFGATAM